VSSTFLSLTGWIILEDWDTRNRNENEKTQPTPLTPVAVAAVSSFFQPNSIEKMKNEGRSQEEGRGKNLVMRNCLFFFHSPDLVFSFLCSLFLPCRLLSISPVYEYSACLRSAISSPPPSMSLSLLSKSVHDSLLVSCMHV